MGRRGRVRGGGNRGGATSSITAVNSVAPVLASPALVGQSPVITQGTWSGAPVLTYSLEINAVSVASGTKAQVQAYVYVVGSAGLNAIVYEIPNGNAALRVASNTVQVTSVPTVTVAPAVAGVAELGQVLTVTPGTYAGFPAPTVTRKWKRAGVDIAGATGLTYTTLAADAPQLTGTIAITCVETATNSQGAVTGTSNAIVLPTVHAQINTRLGANCRTQYQVWNDAAFRTLTVAAVDALIDLNPGTKHNATQAVAGNKPAFSTTSFAGYPGVTFDGGDALLTAAFNLTADERGCLMVLVLDTIATIYILSDFGGAVSGRLALVVNDAAGTIATYAQAAANAQQARSDNTHGLATGKVVTGTIDYTLTTNAAEIRENGTNVTATRPLNADASAATMANAALCVGNRATLDLGLQGTLAALVFATYPSGTPHPTADYTAVANILLVSRGLA